MTSGEFSESIDKMIKLMFYVPEMDTAINKYHKFVKWKNTYELITKKIQNSNNYKKEEKEDQAEFN